MKLIFTGLQWAALGGAAVLAGMACFFRSATKTPAPVSVADAKSPALARGIMAGAGITLTLPLILALACGVNWDGTFVLFHKVFFRNDYWIFDAATDPVITVLPDGFFLHCAIAIFVLVAVSSAFILAACYAILKRGTAVERT